jgi:hypothetical protein
VAKIPDEYEVLRLAAAEAEFSRATEAEKIASDFYAKSRGRQVAVGVLGRVIRIDREDLRVLVEVRDAGGDEVRLLVPLDCVEIVGG